MATLPDETVALEPLWGLVVVLGDIAARLVMSAASEQAEPLTPEPLPEQEMDAA